MRWSVELSKKNWLGRINMQKVVIALYALGDDESVLCTATNAQLGKACGLSAEAIKTHLHRLDNDGHIRTFQKEGYHITKRIIVFLDATEAEATIAEIEKLRRKGYLSRKEQYAIYEADYSEWCRKQEALENQYA